MNEFTTRFRRFKDRTGLTQVELSVMFGVAESTVKRWYCGTTSRPPVDILRTLTRFEIENIDEVAKVGPRAIAAFKEGYGKAREA